MSDLAYREALSTQKNLCEIYLRCLVQLCKTSLFSVAALAAFCQSGLSFIFAGSV